MTQKVNYAAHPGNPANQPFIGAGRKNLTKTKSWWNPASSTYWAARKKK